MKKSISLLYICQFYSFVVCTDYDGWLKIRIEHSLNCGNDNFCPRGNIIVQDNVGLKSSKGETAAIEQTPFTTQDMNKLKELAQEDEFYTIRAYVTSAGNKDKETEFLSSMKAKSYLKSGLSDVINAWVLPNGAVTAVSFQVRNLTNNLIKEDSDSFKLFSNFYLHYVDQAPIPDTASYVQKLEREREARERGELQDNRSFIMKYWMYILPVAILFMVSGAANPEGGQASR